MNNWNIKQFEDKGLAHFSYAVWNEDHMILVDPGRDPKDYYDFASETGAKIIGVIETHPHADFVSSHLEIHHQTDATLYTSSLSGVDYPHQAFDEGDEIMLGDKVSFKALHTPGHSPDSISVVLEADGHPVAVFTGDTLFIGDVGRPDLREKAGKLQEKRESLARAMYKSTREKLMTLPDEVLVYPAHGAGSLCGKSLSDAQSSTIGAEKRNNYALQDMDEQAFVKLILADQPFVPKYFPFDVELNRKGAPAYATGVENVPLLETNFHTETGDLLIDGRPADQFKKSHRKGAINLQDGEKFETWLGSIIGPEETFYLLAENRISLYTLIKKAAKIGYEGHIKGAFIYDLEEDEAFEAFDQKAFDQNKAQFRVVDVRNKSEVKGKTFEETVNIPLHELRERIHEIKGEKPIVVHCAGGYRSAAGSSIIKKLLDDRKVLDMSEKIKEYTD
ncbi:MBL fold metallo-hydrolase [Pararhodonellum marinum]|uniref:MBL fold metallo-hydrolase n=1 Tax=Pararhodonellum marinum TaxID=2755358 RepID=UPI00293BD09B|nr:MBL fold metallo-hydrolase [Pararhodonellum marinum]